MLERERFLEANKKSGTDSDLGSAACRLPAEAGVGTVAEMVAGRRSPFQNNEKNTDLMMSVKLIQPRAFCVCVSLVRVVIICLASTHTALVSSPSLAVLHLSTYLPPGLSVRGACIVRILFQAEDDEGGEGDDREVA